MGISNDWQNIDNIDFIAVQVTIGGNQRTVYFWTEQSAQKIADAIGWETVEFPDDVTSIDYGGVAYDTSVITMIRPIDSSEPYNIGFFWGYLENLNTGINGLFMYEISTGIYKQAFDYVRRASLMLLRPFAQGCFCLKGSRQLCFDRFYNPKSDKEKWGIITVQASPYFMDLYTGLHFSCQETGTAYVLSSVFAGYLVLKKYTAIASAGVFNSLTMYRSYIDYSNSNKNIELNGQRYTGVTSQGNSYTTPFYIPLA